MFPGGMEVGQEELEALGRVIESKNLFRYYGVGNGPDEVASFEREFAELMGAKHALCLNAGSSALICALIGAGVGEGDEVIVPAYTWNATPNAVLASRAMPVLAEVDESLTLDPEDVERRITSRTRAIVPVHMRGAPADMAALTAIAERHGLVLIEDVCQAAGATFRGRRLGTFGDAGAFSLQFNKIITTGEGGVMITDRDDLLDLALDVHDCANSVRRGVGLPKFAGYNFRASELTGAMARVQLSRLDGLLERMRRNHARLSAQVGGLPGLTLRRGNDDDGDAGIALIAFAEDAERARDAVDALNAEGVLAMRIYAPDTPDLHVYPFWAPVLAAIEASGWSCARVSAHPRVARALDPHRRVASLRGAGPGRDRVRLREGGQAGPRVRLRIGVVGGGLVAQAMHLHFLAQMRDRFELVAVVDPSATVRTALQQRYNLEATYSDYRELLDGTKLDAVVICSPSQTHAEVTLAALDQGLHVFVEKPMCITLADADRIVEARERTGKVVQVGYMKRFDRAWERMLENLPESAESLRYIRVMVHDPEFVPFFAPGEIVRGSDIPPDVLEAGREQMRAQVKAAVGDDSPAVITAFEGAFLGSLVHDVNVVHGLLERLGEPLPAEVIDGDWWNEGQAVTGAVRLANGARWDSAWIQLLDVYEYRESVAFYFAEEVHTLSFPSPWLKQSPTLYEASRAQDGARVVESFESYEESFARELAHFHDCVVNGTECRTPPEQARLDMAVLTEMFLKAGSRDLVAQSH